MQYFTGSKDHNVAIRTRAVKMGLKLSEYGLFRAEDDVDGGRRNRSRRLRSDRPGLDSARAARELRRNRSRRRRPPAASGGAGRHARRPPHAHYRDRWPRDARRNGRRPRGSAGYEYIAITDHSKALAMANGLDERRAVAFARQVREINRDGAGHPHLLRPRVRHSERWRARSGERRAGRAGPGDRQRAQPHEPGIGRDDRPAAARARMPARARSGPSHRPAAAAARSLFRSISTAWRRKPCGAACGSKSTPAPSAWT